MTFSERYGMTPQKALQVEDMDEELRTSIWIKLEWLFDTLNEEARNLDSLRARYREFLEYIWTEFFQRPKSQLVQYNYYHIVHSAIRPLYDQLSWDKVYSLIEFIARTLVYLMPKKANSFKEHCNYVLERESSGWRFIGNDIAPITGPHEIKCIEEAFEGVDKETAYHLSNMLREFSQKGKKYYQGARNEAMLAVEAYAREITGEKSKILSDLCAGDKLPLHKSLRKSLSQLYGYSSDEIRHAKKPGSDEADYDDARFMLMQCTSYINLMKAKHKR